MDSKRPYKIDILNNSYLHIVFDPVVPADSFFAYCAEIQNYSKIGIFEKQKIESIYFDFSKTVWFDTLAACYLLMFAEQAKMNRVAKNIRFYFSVQHDWEGIVDSPNNYSSFHAFLHDNGFLAQMKRIGTVENIGAVAEIQYSSIHKCVWPLQVFHDGSEIEGSIELIKKVFLKSSLTPQDIVIEARKKRTLTGDTSRAIYEHIIFALYNEMCKNPKGAVVEALYQTAWNYVVDKGWSHEYLRIARAFKKGENKSFSIAREKMTFFFFFFAYTLADGGGSNE